MKFKQKLEIIFMSILIIILIGLISICAMNKEYPSMQYDYNKEEIKLDYIILDKTDNCENDLSEIYHNDEYTYYIKCSNVDLIYLEWNNGEVNLLKNDLKSGKVTIDSLISHGLDIERRYNNED